MKSLVVFFAVVAAACGGLVPAQPAHYPAIVLDAHARPLDTAEVINARAIHLQAKALEHSTPYHYAPLVHAPVVPIAHAVHPIATTYVGGSAVTHQSRVDVHSSPVVAHSLLAPHWLHKRSLGHLSYAAPLIAHVAPAAVSHQSRVDVHSSPAVVAHAVAAPVVAHAVAAPVVAHVAPAAVSHQSRVDVRTSHPVVSHAVVAAPVVAAHSAISAWPAYGHGYNYGHGLGHGLGHLLKKRSLAFAHVVPAAVSHQSRVDVITSHEANLAVAHVAPLAVVSSHVTPLAHSAVWTAPAAHWAQSPLALAAHW